MVQVVRTIADIVSLRTRPMSRRSTARRPRRAVRPTPSHHAASSFVEQPVTADHPADDDRRRWRPTRRLVALSVMVVLVGGALLVAVMTMPRLAPGARHVLTNDPSPVVSFTVSHPSGVRAERIAVTVDGDPVVASAIAVHDQGATIDVTLPPLQDGAHGVRLKLGPVGMLRRHLDAAVEVRVDTVAPAARIVAPVAPVDGSAYVDAGVLDLDSSTLDVTVGAELGTHLELRSSVAPDREAVTVEAGDTVRRHAHVQLPDGLQEVSVAAIDAAGNRTERRLTVLVDTTGPSVTVRAPRTIRIAELNLPVTAADMHGVTIEAKLDGVAVDPSPLVVASTTPAPNVAAAGDGGNDGDDSGTDVTAADEGDELPAPVAVNGTIQIETGAFEGRHVLTLVARDSADHTTTLRRAFLVDSTDDLADVSGIRPGARGRDVLQLQQALVGAGAATSQQLAAEQARRIYGTATRAAVQRFQTDKGIDTDGVAGATTLAVLTLKIVVDRSTHTLTLWRLGRIEKTYPVAVGSPEYPTPPGDFSIQDMQVDPTWTPPKDSPWAKDAKVTPPGPDNPLGTRWMSINPGQGIGIHGTNSPESLGYSVSHGCIRMAIPDVEDLYERVTLGTPVQVV